MPLHKRASSSTGSLGSVDSSPTFKRTMTQTVSKKKTAAAQAKSKEIQEKSKTQSLPAPAKVEQEDSGKINSPKDFLVPSSNPSSEDDERALDRNLSMLVRDIAMHSKSVEHLPDELDYPLASSTQYPTPYRTRHESGDMFTDDEPSSQAPQQTLRTSPRKSTAHSNKSGASPILSSGPERNHSSRKSTNVSSTGLRYSCPDPYAPVSLSNDTLWLEDLEKGDKELWLLRVPSEFDLKKLQNTEILPDSTTVLDKKRVKDYRWELHAGKAGSQKLSNTCVILPSKKDEKLHYGGMFVGEAWVTHTLKSEPYIIPENEKKMPQIPKGLKMRNVPFGSDSPRLTAHNRKKEKRQKKRKRNESEEPLDYAKKVKVEAEEDHEYEIEHRQKKKKKDKKKKKSKELS